MSAVVQLTLEEKEDAWRLGLVGPWYLRPSQLDIYSLLCTHRNPFIEASRRFGKTTSILAYVLEQLRANPGWVCRWVLPEKDQARTIVKPEIEKMQELCPEELKFKWQTTDSVFNGPGGSKIFLYGIDKDAGKKIRGQFAHIVVCDEYGFWSKPDIIKSVIRPTLLTTRGQLIIASTPSEDLAHPYYLMKGRAMHQGRFIQKTIHDNESLTPEEIATEMEEQGGAESETWQREYLCKAIPNKRLQVVPEYDEDRHDLPDDTPKPEHYDCYVFGDSGFDDNNALLFAYVDWLKQELVIEDEIVCNGVTSEKLITDAKAKEAQLWTEKRGQQFYTRKPKLRLLDATKQALFDIAQLYDYSVVIPDKQDKDANYRQVRVAFSNLRIRIKKRCVNLRYQLKVGHWKDERHTDFKRDKLNKKLGHLDAIAALFYGWRAIDWNSNPYPQKTESAWPDSTTPSSPGESALISAFSLNFGSDLGG